MAAIFAAQSALALITFRQVQASWLVNWFPSFYCAFLLVDSRSAEDAFEILN